MSVTMTGAELFRVVLHPRTTKEEIAVLDLETLTRKVTYRRKRKVPKAALSPDLTDEEIARVILSYARGGSDAKLLGAAKQGTGQPEEQLVCPDCHRSNPPDCLFCLDCGAIL